MEGKSQDGNNKFSYQNAAKTLWLAAGTKDQSTGLLPFGWLLVEVQPITSPIQEWLVLKDACEPHLADARIFANKLAELQEDMKMVRINAEAKRREEEENARQLAAEKARAAQAEADRQAKIAAMTTEQREIESFRVVFESARSKGAYNASDSVFNEHRLKLFKRALDWGDAITRKEAASLLRETIQWSGWPGKRERKAEFKAWLETLEASR
jgi:CRISPR-associated protein Csm5